MINKEDSFIVLMTEDKKYVPLMYADDGDTAFLTEDINEAIHYDSIEKAKFDLPHINAARQFLLDVDDSIITPKPILVMTTVKCKYEFTAL